MVEVALNKLDTWLQNQIANTVDTPYEIKITDDLGDDIENVKSVATILKNNSTKYVSLEITATGLSSLFTVFEYCISLVSINIPDSVTQLYSAFSYCRNLKNITIPDGVIGLNRTFYECDELTTINIPSSVTSMEKTFWSCNKLTTVNMPLTISVSSLDETFSGCSRLSSIFIPSGVTSLNGTFQNCGELTSVILPNSITRMSGTFFNCKKLVSIEIPNSVTEMEGTFNGCDGLVIAPTIPENVTNLNNCFNGCKNLTHVIIPNGVQRLNTTFRYCTSLEEITIPEAVTDIGGICYGCTSLKTVNNIPFSVNYMNEAFAYCTSLETLNDWKITDTTNVNMTDCFSGCTSLTNIYVPVPIETADTWKVVKLQGSANSVDYAIYDSSTGTKLAYGTIPIGDYGYADLYEYTDEILFDAKDAITEAKIQEFILYKVKFGTNGLDPSKKNFVFWADDPDAFVTNMDLGGSTAEEAEKLKTARTINGTSFDGTANITTSKWGTARTIAIKDKNGTSGTTTSVDGSGNVTLTLPTTLLTTSDIWIE